MENPVVLLDAILTFARDHPGIDAVVLTGSRGRGERVDEYSDLDVELIGPGTAALVGDDDWYRRFGEVLVSLQLANEDEGSPDWPTCLVVFAGGRKVDFTLAGLDRVGQIPTDPTYARGYRILLDKTGLVSQVPAPAPRRWSAPTRDEFLANQREFWFEASQVPVYARRGDLWPAQSRLAEMRDQLLQMLEWQARAADPGADTWHNGHHLGEWSEFRAQIPNVFATYDGADILRAHAAAVELYAAAIESVPAGLGLPSLGVLQPKSD